MGELGAFPVKPDCVVACAMGDTRLPEAMNDCHAILAAGVNAVGSDANLGGSADTHMWLHRQRYWLARFTARVPMRERRIRKDQVVQDVGELEAKVGSHSLTPEVNGLAD